MRSRETTQTAVRNRFTAGLRRRQVLLLLTQALVIAGVASVLPTAGAQVYTVSTVVSDSTPRADGAGKFSPVNPSLDGDFIVFNQGNVCAGCAAPDSLWAANTATGELRKLVSTSTAIPGGSGSFGSFSAAPIARGGSVVFIGYDANSRPGLYKVPTAGGAVVRLADTSTGVPGASKPFTTFGFKGFQHDGTTVVFTGGATGVTGVYSVRLDGSGLARVADSNTPVNSQVCDLFPVMTFSKPSISNGNIGFLGQTTFDYSVGFSAFYTQPLSKAAAPACAGPSPSAANSEQGLPINPAVQLRTQLDYGRMDGAKLVFRAAKAGTAVGGIFSTGLDMSSAGGALTTIVDSTTQLPGFGAVSFIGNFNFAVDAGNTVFQAYDSTGQKSALFLAAGGVVTRIAGAGDAAGSSTIAAVDAPGAGSVQAAAVAFTGTSSDGSRTIYFARPTPAVVSSPSISAVANAASSRAGAVSPGEIVVVYGAGIGPAAIAVSSLDPNGRLSNVLAGTRILFDGVAAPLLYVLASQSAAIVPYSVDGHSQTQMTVEYQGTASSPMVVPVTGAAPGIFSADTSGQGQGAILNQDFSPNSKSNPAAAGSIVAVYATGEGQTAPGGVDGQMAVQPFPAPKLPVTAAVDGQNADILYAGAAPGEVAGLIQINIRLPLGLAAGNIPIAFSVGGVASQPGLTVAVK
jgi:uncharacterized protein (TIGR03437 family)